MYWRVKTGVLLFMRILIGLFTLTILFSPLVVSATHFTDIVRGKILLDVEQSGEAWYVYPTTLQRYFLGRPTDAFDIMRELSIGITDADLALIPIVGSGGIGNINLKQRLSGHILLQVEQNGEAWYVYPDTLERYYLGRPADAFAIMTELGLGISSANLAHIPIATSSLEPPLFETSSHRFFTISTSDGSFPIHVISLDREAFEMVTDTAENEDCESDCTAQSLQAYVLEHEAFAGIHGTYFCPPDYPPCQSNINTFLPPVYKTDEGYIVNEDGLETYKRPMIVQTESGELLYFHRAQEFGESVQEFESRTGNQVHAAIGNWPSLMENGSIVVNEEPLEPSFSVKATRGGIGWSEDVVFLVIAQSASVSDLAGIFHALSADFAMNLDGGGSAGLFYGGSYKVEPGRLLPNAIVFRKRL